MHYVSFKENKVDVWGIVISKNPVPEQYDLICNFISKHIYFYD